MSAQIAPKGSKLFIAAIKKKIPMIVVTDEAEADYIMTGASLKADDRWYNTVFGESGDRSLWTKRFSTR